MNNYLPVELLDLLSVQISDWDVLIIGDGSGSFWGKPSGWACLLFDGKDSKPNLFYGSINNSTVNISELFPYCYSLLWYSRGPGKDKLAIKEARIGKFATLNVHIITDCKIIADQGNNKCAKASNAPMWGMLDVIKRFGYSFTFHYVERNTFKEMIVCDRLSKIMRESCKLVHETYKDDDQLKEFIKNE